MSLSKVDRNDMRTAAQMSITCKIDGPWEDIVSCLDDLDEKDEEIEALKEELENVGEVAILWAGLSAVERQQAIDFNMRNPR